jgi:hypothetical protein
MAQQQQIQQAMQMLNVASQMMNQGHFQQAADIFTQILSNYPMIQPMMPTLSRAIWYVVA